MAFITKEWKDRLTEFAGRRRLTNVATGEETVVEVARAEGMVSQPGDAFSAANMNDLEQRVKDGFDQVDSDLSGCTFDVKSDGAYVTYTPAGGADPVSKKLGEPNITSQIYNCTKQQSGSYAYIKSGRNLWKDMFIIPHSFSDINGSDTADAFVYYYNTNGRIDVLLWTKEFYVNQIQVFYLDY